MSGIESLLASRASFVLAALLVSWAATFLLALVATNLHVRLAHLERTLARDDRRRPYSHLLGKPLADLGDGMTYPSALLFLSARCPACERLLEEIGERRDRAAVAVVWRDGNGPNRPALPAGVTQLADGPRLARALGIRVSPFAITLDAAGRVAGAAPATSWRKVLELMAESNGQGDESTPDAQASTSIDNPTLQGASS